MEYRRRKILYEKYLEEHGQQEIAAQKISEKKIEESEEECADIRLILSGFFGLLKNLILLLICLTILGLASVGAVVLFNEPLRRAFIDTCLPLFFK